MCGLLVDVSCRIHAPKQAKSCPKYIQACKQCYIKNNGHLYPRMYGTGPGGAGGGFPPNMPPPPTSGQDPLVLAASILATAINGAQQQQQHAIQPSLVAPRSRTMSFSSVSGSSTSGLPPIDSMRYDVPPPMPPPTIKRDQDGNNFRADVPPPNMSKPPPVVKPDTVGGQSTHVRYPKEALNRSESSLSSPWEKSVSEKSFNFKSPIGNQPFVFKGPNSNPRDDVSGQAGMKKPVNQRLGHQAYGQSNNSMKRYGSTETLNSVGSSTMNGAITKLITNHSNNIQIDTGNENFNPKHNSSFKSLDLKRSRNGITGHHHTMDVDSSFNGSVKDAQEDSGYDNIPVGLLKCTLCESTMTDGPSFERHLKGKPHAELGEMLSEQHEMITNLLRQQASLVERRKAIVANKTAKFKNQNREVQTSTCNMCQVDVYGFNSVQDMRIHRQSYYHQMLKEFLHPACSSCNLEFQQRRDWDAHKFTSEHLRNLANEGITEAQYEFYDKYTLGILNNDINTVLKGPFASENASTTDQVESEDALAKKKEDIEEKIREDEINSLSDANILQYRIPRFSESKIIGSSYTKPVVGIFCTLCKKFETKTLSEHCTERKHYEKFALNVNSRKRKVKSKERSSQVTEEDEVMKSPKRQKFSPSPNHRDTKEQVDEEDGELSDVDDEGEEAEDILLLNDPLDKLY